MSSDNLKVILCSHIITLLHETIVAVIFEYFILNLFSNFAKSAIVLIHSIIGDRCESSFAYS